MDAIRPGLWGAFYRNVNYRTLLILLALFLFVFAVRIPIFVPLGESDEVPFCTIGRHIAEGQLIYKEIAHFKGPLRYFAFAAFHVISGDLTPVTLRVALTFYIFLSTAFLFFAIRNFYDDERLAIIGSFFWAISDYMLSHNTVMTYTYGIIGIFFFSLFVRKQKTVFLFCMGLFFGISIMTNQRSYPFILVPGFYYLVKHGFSRKMITLTLITALGYLLPVLLTLFVIHRLGVWEDFVFQYLFKSRAYSDKISLLNYIVMPAGKIVSLIRYQLGLLFVFFVFQLYDLIKKKECKKDANLFLLLWLLICFVAAMIDGKYVKRYNLFFFIPAMIFSFQGLFVVYARYKERITAIGKVKKILLLSLVIPLFLIQIFFVFNYEIGRKVSSYNKLQTKRNEIEEVKRYLEANLDKQKDFIYVYNVHRGYDCFAEYKPAVRFIYSMEQLFDKRAIHSDKYRINESWDYFYHDMNKNRPKIIIDISGKEFNRATDYGNTIQNSYRDKLYNYVNEHYQLDKQVDKTTFYKRLD